MAGKSARRELKFICRHKEATQGESKKEKLVTSGVCYASMLQRETDPINSKPTQKNSRGKKRQLRSTLIATVILKANEKLSGEEREGLLSSPPPLLYSDPSTSPLESFFDSLQFCVSFNVQDGGENICSIIVYTCKIFQLCTLERRQQTLCEQASEWFCLKTIFAKLRLLLKVLVNCLRPNQSNIYWTSRQTCGW